MCQVVPMSHSVPPSTSKQFNLTLFIGNPLLQTYNYIIRMNNNPYHFQDSIQMLKHQTSSLSPATTPSQHTPAIEPSLSSEQKSSEKYQKSNNSPSEQEEQRDNDQRLKVWTLQQQNTLISLHNLKGNKWVEISQALHKSDNEVKNHYHSKLRKGIRKMNKLICEDGMGMGKCINGNIISKIIQTAEDVFNANPAPQAKEAYQLKNAILAIANMPEEDLDQSHHQLIAQTAHRVTAFNKNYRKKCKITPLKPPTCTKYKGKEIKTLLRENELSTFQNNRRERVRHCPKEEIISHKQMQIHIPSPIPIVPQPVNAYQAYVVYNQPCFAYSYPSFSSFYLTCLPTSHLETYDRLSSVQMGEASSNSQVMLPTSMEAEEQARQEDSEVSFR